MIVFLHLVLQYATLLAGGVDTSPTPLRILTETFDLDSESSVPTYLASFLMTCAAFLTWTIASLAQRTGARHIFAWRVFASVFTFVAIDEIASWHERLIGPLWNLLEAAEMGAGGLFRFAWVVPALVALGLLVPLCWRAVATLPPRIRGRFLLGISTLLLGAIGLEMVGGLLVYRAGGGTIATGFAHTFEEAFEFAGVLLIVDALFLYVRDHFDGEHGGFTIKPR